MLVCRGANLEHAMADQKIAEPDIADRLARLIDDDGMEGIAGPVKRFETHLSHVILAGDRAFKLKKPVRMPFVDFSTLERRHAACQIEVEINRRMGSPLYLGVVALTEQDDGSLELDGDGTTIDWAVMLRRFDSAQQFDILAEAGKLDDELALRTADRIVGMHAGLKPVRTSGHAADYRKVIRDLHATEVEGAAALGVSIGEPSPYDALDRALAHVDPLIEERRMAGKVRRTHGDLHLRNICLFEGEVTPFDALEFDERLATTDVLYDLAFLLMDMRAAGLTRQANIVMNRYWDSAREDEEALALLPFFMALRAAVRMAVAVEAGNLAEAQTYRQLCLDVFAPERPVLIAIGGLSGSGKSTIARELAQQLPGPAGARLLRSDVIRKQSMAWSPELARADGSAYVPERRAQVYRELGEHAAKAVSAGASVIADATFGISSAREALTRVKGASCYAFWLRLPLATRLARISGRGKDASDADVSVAIGQVEPCNLGEEWQVLDASGEVGAVVRQILQEVATQP